MRELLGGRSNATTPLGLTDWLKNTTVTKFYLILVMFLAFSLNHSSRILRALGTLTAALALLMISWSIILANLDGTFAAIPAGTGLADRIKPFVLNTQAAIAAVAAVFLLCAVWAQGIRRVSEPLPLRNTLSAFGRVSRYAHWVIGTLILVLLPMGLFTSVLAADHPERGAFLAMHQTLGLTVLLLVVLSEARALAIEGSSMTIGGMVLHASMFGLWVPPNTPYTQFRWNLLATDTGSPRTQRRLER